MPMPAPVEIPVPPPLVDPDVDELEDPATGVVVARPVLLRPVVDDEVKLGSVEARVADEDKDVVEEELDTASLLILK